MLNKGEIYRVYGMEDKSQNLLEHIAIKLGRIQRGGIPDERAAAIAILNDHMRGKLPIFENSENPLRYLNSGS